jgi:predicted DNA-binding transcriptional regulator AlpA
VSEKEAARPTLEEIRTWPATVSVEQASLAYGFSRSLGYQLARQGEFPAKVIRVGTRLVVVTADIISQLSAKAA